MLTIHPCMHPLSIVCIAQGHGEALANPSWLWARGGVYPGLVANLSGTKTEMNSHLNSHSYLWIY